jgi:hypothetical protein
VLIGNLDMRFAVKFIDSSYRRVQVRVSAATKARISQAIAELDYLTKTHAGDGWRSVTIWFLQELERILPSSRYKIIVRKVKEKKHACGSESHASRVHSA